MTDKELLEVKHKFAEGYDIERCSKLTPGKWELDSHPIWSNNYEYRVKR